MENTNMIDNGTNTKHDIHIEYQNNQKITYDEYIKIKNDILRGMYAEMMYNDEYIYKFKTTFEIVHWINELYKHYDGISIILKSKYDYTLIYVIDNSTGEIIYMS